MNDIPSISHRIVRRCDGSHEVEPLVDSVERASVRCAYARSAESRRSNEFGQDFVTYVLDRKIAIFALCDGVSQSFFGDLAARFLGGELCFWLANFNLAPDANVLERALTDVLSKRTRQASRLIARAQVDPNTPALQREVLEQKRQMGSETTFVCGRIDVPSAEFPDGQVFLAWMGDSRLRFWGPDGERTDELGDTFRTFERWSTKRGPVEGQPHVFVGPILERGRRRITRLLAYSDGLAALDRYSQPLSNFALQDLIDHAGELPASDDISLLEIWLDGVPPIVEASPAPAIEDVAVEVQDACICARWPDMPGATAYEVEVRDQAVRRFDAAEARWRSDDLGSGVYRVRVRARIGDERGDWSETATVEMLGLAPAQAAGSGEKATADSDHASIAGGEGETAPKEPASGANELGRARGWERLEKLARRLSRRPSNRQQG